MKIAVTKGTTSRLLEFVMRDSSTGAPKSGIAFGSVTINYTRQGASSETAITAVTMTAGTWVSSGWVEFGTSGKYQLGIPNAVLASGANEASITIAATGAVTKEITIQLSSVDLQDAVRGGMTAMPNAAAGANGGLPLSVDASGRVDVLKINGTSQTARDIGASVLLSTGTGTGQLDFTSGVVKSNLAQILGTALTETAGLIAAGFKKFFNIATPTGTLNSLPGTAAGLTGGLPLSVSATGQVDALKINGTSISANAAAGLDSMGGDYFSNNFILTDIMQSAPTWYAAPPTSTTTATAVWNAVTSGLTTVGSIGKLLVTNIDGAISSRMVSYTQPTGFLAATFPTTVASPTNITGGTITTVTNLTNLPAIPTNWITASGINAAAFNGKGDWNTLAPDNTTITTINTGITALLKSGIVVGSDFVFSVNALQNAPAGGGGSGGFTGSKQCTLTFNDANSAPVANVVFSVVGTGTAATSGAGSITVGLNPGTYTVTANPQSGTMWASTTITVTSSATQAFTITGTANTTTPAADPGACTIYDTARGTDNAIKAGVAYTFQVIGRKTGAGIQTINSRQRTVTSVGTSPNNISITLQRDHVVLVCRGTFMQNASQQFIVPEQGAANLVDLIGGNVLGQDAASP